MTELESNAYVLGTEDAEIERLRFQHVVWTQQQLELCVRAGFRAGATLIDLGCGPGFTAFELAKLVGPEGRVIARDTSERFLDFLEAEAARRGVTQVEPSLGPVEDLDLAPRSLDGAYSRWLLSWLPDAAPLLAEVARALRPGGVFALQEYTDWGAMRALPRHPAFDRAIDACMAYWEASGQTIDVANDLPRLAAEAGLEVVAMAPNARMGAIGSLEWRWIGGFLHAWLPKLVAADAFGAADLDAFREAWRGMEDGGIHRLATPVLADVLLRRA